MSVTLVKLKDKALIKYGFESISDAYYYYLKHFSTRSEWEYYRRCAGLLLNQVENEKIMESIFRNVFDKNVCLTIDNGR